MTEEFDLSKWITYIEERKASFIRDTAVKEFIRRLKEEISSTHGAGCTALKFIDKLAGERLK